MQLTDLKFQPGVDIQIQNLYDFTTENQKDGKDGNIFQILMKLSLEL